MKRLLLLVVWAVLPWVGFTQSGLTEFEEQCLSELIEAGYSFDSEESNSAETFRVCGWDSYYKKNYKDASYWFEKAAKLGDIESFLVLGVMHENGDYYTPSAKDALRCYLVPAATGVNMAQLLLGNIYYNAEDWMLRNYHRARFWWKIAAANGNETASQNLQSYYPGCQLEAVGATLRQHTSATLKTKGIISEEDQAAFLFNRKVRELLYVMINMNGAVMVGDDIVENLSKDLDTAIIKEINDPKRFLEKDEFCCVVIDHIIVNDKSDATYKLVCQSLERIRTRSQVQYLVFDSEYGAGYSFANQIGGKVIPPPPPAPVQDIIDSLEVVDE